MSLLRKGIRTEFTTGKVGVSGETEVVHYNSGEQWDGTSRIIIALHGHGTPGDDVGSPAQYQQNAAFAGRLPMYLAFTGRYIVCAIEGGGATSWSKPSVMDDIDTAVAALRTRGGKTGKYGILGYSMGGLEAFNKLKRDAAHIAAMWCWAPAIDLDYVYSTTGHPIKANNAAWTSEVNAAFGSYANTAGYRVWDEPASFRGLGVPVKIAHATDDSVIPVSVSKDFVAAVGDSLITMRTPDVTGDHTGLFTNVPDDEIVSFFDSANWA